MNVATRTPLRARSRRSQAQRTAETRTRIIDAAVESISEVGFQNTTAAEIVRRAGLTWGAVQHQFGGKDGILKAVLEACFDHFAQCLGDIEPGNRSLKQRIDLFVDRAWDHFGSPEYRCTFEILLNSVGPEGSDPASLWQSEMFQAWHHIWARAFSDARLSRKRMVLLQHYTISVLSGLACTQILGAPALKPRSGPFLLLKQTLWSELSVSEN